MNGWNPVVQREKAERLRSLHFTGRILILPNIWDPLGARMLEALGYPAVATASAAVAFSLGYDDGQQISLTMMLEVVQRIAGSIDIPLTADMESGYGKEPEAVAENMRQALLAGAVGINLEDSQEEGGDLFDVEFQCERIRAIREMAGREGIPMVINARTDVYLSESDQSEADKFREACNRAKAYLEAGADCVYPITLSDLPQLRKMREELQAPINVYLPLCRDSLRELEDAGIARASLGPAMIKASLARMKKIAVELLNYGSYDVFLNDSLSSGEIKKYIR